MLKQKHHDLATQENKKYDEKLTLTFFKNKPTCNLSVFRKDSYLEGVKIIGQFILNKKSLITLISENHKDNFKCDSNRTSMTIEDYCLLKKENNNIKICLEYNDDVKDDELDKIGSVNIQQIAKNDELNQYIIKYDIRRKYLTRDEQDLLYNSYNLDTEFYINIFKLIFNDIKVDRCKNKLENKNYYMTLSNKIIKKFKKIDCLVNSSINIIKTINILRKLFAMIVDYFLLRKIFMDDLVTNSENKLVTESVNDPVNEYIVIAGDYHIKNILANITEANNISLAYIDDIVANKKNQKCVDLYDSLFVKFKISS